MPATVPQTEPERPDPPPITPQVRAQARAAPGTWLYAIDPAFDSNGAVPPRGIIGAYAVDEHGRIDPAFVPNPDYRPSPVALGMPEPASELEHVLQLIRTGHRDEAELPAAVLRADLLLYAASGDDREITAFPAAGHDLAPGHRAASPALAVPACTSVAHVPIEWPAWRTVRGSDLATWLGDHPLVLNPNGPISAVVPAAALAGA